DRPGKLPGSRLGEALPHSLQPTERTIPMKRILLLAGIALALAAPVARASTVQTTTTAFTAYASFESSSEDGCVVTTTHLNGSQQFTSVLPSGQTNYLNGCHVD